MIYIRSYALGWHIDKNNTPPLISLCARFIEYKTCTAYAVEFLRTPDV